MEDKELIYKIQHGNKELLEILIEKYYDDIYRFCYYKTGNSSLSYDSTQETFLKLIKYIGTYCFIQTLLRKIKAMRPI